MAFGFLYMLQQLQLDWLEHPKATPQDWLGLHGPFFSSNCFWGGLRARPAVTYLFYCNEDI